MNAPIKLLNTLNMRKKTILMDYCLLTVSIRHRRKKRFRSKNMNDHVTKPIMMYNKPLTDNINTENETIYKIDQELDKVEYIKESIEGIRKVRMIINSTELVMFCDSDDLTYESFVQGATGWVSVTANLAPNSAAKLYELVKAGKYVQIVKKAMDLKGLNGVPSRKPRLGLTDEEVNKLKSLMEKLD